MRNSSALGRLQLGRGAARLTVAVEEPVPGGLREALGRQPPGELLQRAAQAHQVRVTPQAGTAQLTAVEVDEIDLLFAEEYVVRVEVRVADAEVVEAADAPSDRDPGEDGERPGAQAFRERADRRQPLGDQGARVGDAAGTL